ncbi:MAG: phenylalanine--tRNA ligase beta subunit-related protein, partial [Planctomycetota bacterium]|nr:phenylalanine--tRNA ligase beta subunit-related protein [Planctomycetota bacterium]
MNISFKWLKEYVPTDLSVRDVAEALTRVGLNVDNITDLPGGDACILVEVTSNRPDCLGHLGVARELAAALGTKAKFPDVAYEESPEAAESLTKVEIEDLALCPLYTARIVKGVKVGPSPAWMAERLEAVGVRPINNIVDVTNYVMMECGQPLHAFDFARLAEGRIVVRRARAGEKFAAIDHSEHTLARERLVIADARRAVAMAGVMGGVDTEISTSTADVLLEAAVFDPLSIRTTARSLAMMSESSYRFERR